MRRGGAGETSTTTRLNTIARAIRGRNMSVYGAPIISRSVSVILLIYLSERQARIPLLLLSLLLSHSPAPCFYDSVYKFVAVRRERERLKANSHNNRYSDRRNKRRRRRRYMNMVEHKLRAPQPFLKTHRPPHPS